MIHRAVLPIQLSSILTIAMSLSSMLRFSILGRIMVSAQTLSKALTRASPMSSSRAGRSSQDEMVMKRLCMYARSSVWRALSRGPSDASSRASRLDDTCEVGVEDAEGQKSVTASFAWSSHCRRRHSRTYFEDYKASQSNHEKIGCVPSS